MKCAISVHSDCYKTSHLVHSKWTWETSDEDTVKQCHQSISSFIWPSISWKLTLKVVMVNFLWYPYNAMTSFIWVTSSWPHFIPKFLTSKVAILGLDLGVWIVSKQNYTDYRCELFPVSKLQIFSKYKIFTLY